VYFVVAHAFSVGHRHRYRQQHDQALVAARAPGRAANADLRDHRRPHQRRYRPAKPHLSEEGMTRGVAAVQKLLAMAPVFAGKLLLCHQRRA